MLPANRDDGTIYVHRHLDADEDDVVEAITVFAEQHSLEMDRRHDGPGLLFVATKDSGPFCKGDSLRVVISPEQGGHDVEFDADLRGSVRAKGDERRRHVVRSGLFAALFAYLGVRGVIPPNGLDPFDILWFGLSARFGLRARHFAASDSEALDDSARKLVNELNRVCDEAEYS